VVGQGSPAKREDHTPAGHAGHVDQSLCGERLRVLLGPRVQRVKGKAVGETYLQQHAFLVPLDAPGVSIRPIYTFAGWRTNETFYDDVRVPHEALIGEVNRGWYIAANALDHERVSIGPFLFCLSAGVVHFLDSSQNLRLEAHHLEKTIPTGSGKVRKLLDGISLAVDAVRVDLEQDRDAVPGPAGDLGRGHPRVEPQRDRRVPQAATAYVMASNPANRRWYSGSGSNANNGGNCPATNAGTVVPSVGVFPAQAATGATKATLVG